MYFTIKHEIPDFFPHLLKKNKKNNRTRYIFSTHSQITFGGCHGHDRMIVCFTAIDAISAYHH